MPLASLMEQEHISPDLTSILTTAFDDAWASSRRREARLRKMAVHPRRALCLLSGLSRRRRRASETPIGSLRTASLICPS